MTEFLTLALSSWTPCYSTSSKHRKIISVKTILNYCHWQEKRQESCHWRVLQHVLNWLHVLLNARPYRVCSRHSYSCMIIYLIFMCFNMDTSCIEGTNLVTSVSLDYVFPCRIVNRHKRNLLVLWGLMFVVKSLHRTRQWKPVAENVRRWSLQWKRWRMYMIATYPALWELLYKVETNLFAEVSGIRCRIVCVRYQYYCCQGGGYKIKTWNDCSDGGVVEFLSNRFIHFVFEFRL